MSFAAELAQIAFRTAFVQWPALTVLFSLIFLLIGYLYLAHGRYHHYESVALDHWIVKEQMKKSEERADLMEDRITSLFIRMRREHRDDEGELVDDEEVKRFQLLISMLREKALNRMRHFYWENHLADYEDQYYEMHIDNRADQILRDMREIYDAWYLRGGKPSAQDFYQRYERELRPQTLEQIKAAFREARRIALSFRDKKYVKQYMRQYDVRGRHA